MEKESVKMVEKKTWDEFRATGLPVFINGLLHIFGWAICFDIDDKGKCIGAYMARVRYRGWDEQSQEDAHIKLAKYMVENAEQLKKETE